MEILQEENTEPAKEAPRQYQPTREEIERTRKVMHDSLSARKPKGFFASIKEWFR